MSASVIDSIINNTNYECDEEDYPEWINSLRQYDFTPLKPLAVKAIDAVLSDNSELKELWEENEDLYTSWREDKLSIRERLL